MIIKHEVKELALRLNLKNKLLTTWNKLYEKYLKISYLTYFSYFSDILANREII